MCQTVLCCVCVFICVCMCVCVCMCARQIHTHMSLLSSHSEQNCQDLQRERHRHMSLLSSHSEQNCQDLKRERRRESLDIINLDITSALSTQTDHGRGGGEGGGCAWGVAADKAFALLSCANASVNGRHCLTFRTSFCNAR